MATLSHLSRGRTWASSAGAGCSGQSSSSAGRRRCGRRCHRQAHADPQGWDAAALPARGHCLTGARCHVRGLPDLGSASLHAGHRASVAGPPPVQGLGCRSLLGPRNSCCLWCSGQSQLGPCSASALHGTCSSLGPVPEPCVLPWSASVSLQTGWLHPIPAELLMLGQAPPHLRCCWVPLPAYPPQPESMEPQGSPGSYLAPTFPRG